MPFCKARQCLRPSLPPLVEEVVHALLDFHATPVYVLDGRDRREAGVEFLRLLYHSRSIFKNSSRYAWRTLSGKDRAYNTHRRPRASSCPGVFPVGCQGVSSRDIGQKRHHGRLRGRIVDKLLCKLRTSRGVDIPDMDTRLRIDIGGNRTDNLHAQSLHASLARLFERSLLAPSAITSSPLRPTQSGRRFSLRSSTL